MCVKNCYHVIEQRWLWSSGSQSEFLIRVGSLFRIGCGRRQKNLTTDDDAPDDIRGIFMFMEKLWINY